MLMKLHIEITTWKSLSDGIQPAGLVVYQNEQLWYLTIIVTIFHFNNEIESDQSVIQSAL